MKKQEDPLPRNRFVIALILVLGVFMPFEYKTPPEPNEATNTIQFIGGTSIKATRVPPIQIPETLGMMTGGSLDDKLLLNAIIDCESKWRNVCNGAYGCNAGQGVAQLIPTTVKFCENKLGKKIDPFNIEDSLECAMYLLTETSQGYHHWGYPDDHDNSHYKGIRWGSYNCWSEHI
jgi:hypothetical protein